MLFRSPTNAWYPGQYPPQCAAGADRASDRVQKFGEVPAPLIVADPSEFQERINEFGLVEYWNDVTVDLSNAPVMGINQMHFDMATSLFLMDITIETLAPKSFVKAVVQPDWHPPIIKELDNFCENTCFQWIKDTGQRRHFMMIWLFSFKSDMSKKARMVIV